MASLWSQHPDVVWLDDAAHHDIVVWGATDSVAAGEGFIEGARRLLKPERPPSGVPFAGGLVGYIGYEAGRWVERMPQPVGPRPLPDLVLRRYEGALVRDAEGWVAAGAPDFVQQACRVVERAKALETVVRGQGVERAPEGARFLESVGRALEAIRGGDYYQVNLARRLEVRGVGDAFAAYRRLRRRYAQYGALLRLGDAALLSNSPELFLQVQDGSVRSVPIKGTRPLGEEDALLADPKERAELTMIVDLVRNDLGRVCQPGSVRVSPRRVQEHPTLLHAEQAVHGVLRGGMDALDALGASFPPGSVTGAPKVMAMEAIRALEPVPRGAYTGCVGYFADGGDAQLSVAIRTASVVGDTAWVHVGCGIVADSDPQRELQESEIKAVALREALLG